jgi:serine/threonine-protein kinase
MAMPADKSSPVRDTTLKTKIDLVRIGRYDLIYVLGRGGMATVYMGQVRGLAGFEKLVTIKVIHQHLAQEQSFVDMFLDEARISALIQHPNVAAVQEVGREEGLLYMVGEFVEGQSLRDLMAKARHRSTRLSHPMAAFVASCVCDGLHAAHELIDEEGRPLNLVHRDVSPPNVMISYQGFIKLIDFGVAQARGRLAHTEAGTIKGKMGYLAPEQLRGKLLDRRCDIFALGVMLYEMAIGLHPFPGETELERLNCIASGKYRAPRTVEPTIDPKLERIIVKALAHRREDRFETAAEMSASLRQYIASTGLPMGTEQVVEVMDWLFPEEIAKHRATVKEFREQRLLLDVSGLEPINDRILSFATRSRFSKKSLRLYIVAGAMATLVSAALIALGTMLGPASSPPPFVQATHSGAGLRPKLRLEPPRYTPPMPAAAPAASKSRGAASSASTPTSPRGAAPHPGRTQPGPPPKKPSQPTKPVLKGSPYE